MQLRSRGTLLAGCGALLACAACAGCQTAAVRPEAYAARGGPSASRPWFAFLHRSSAAHEGATVARAPGSPPPHQAVATATVASVWQPVQRVGAEQPFDAPGGVVQASRPADPTAGAARAAVDMPAPPVTIATSNPGVALDVPPPDAAPAGSEPISPPKDLAGPHPAPEAAAVVPAAPVHPAAPPAPHECTKRPLPPYVVEPPDVLLIQATTAVTGKEGSQPVEGPHLVRPDGYVSLGVYGTVYAAGQTLEEIRDSVAAVLHARFEKVPLEDVKKNVVVDVIAYNSKVYYVITDGGGYGEQVYPIPITGNETVLDAIGKVNGLPPVASKCRIWVARPRCDDPHNPQVLPVNWCAVAKNADPETNYQIFPGDRIYVNSDPWIRRQSWLEKRLNPVDRIFGTVLLGSSTVNSIKNRSGTGTTGR
jgi:polysaccharide export outer membrane protein